MNILVTPTQQSHDIILLGSSCFPRIQFIRTKRQHNSYKDTTPEASNTSDYQTHKKIKYLVKMEKTHLIFVPVPGIGHLISMVELAKLLLNRDHRLSITVLLMKPPNFDTSIVDNYINSVANSSSSLPNRLHFFYLPKDEEPESKKLIYSSFVETQKPHVKKAVSKITQSDADSPRLAGLVLDMFCTSLIDVANDFGVPAYIYFTSSAAFLGFVDHVKVLCEEQNFDPTEPKGSDTELAVPCLANPFPTKAMPSAMIGKVWPPILLNEFGRFKESKGIIVNTFFELESYAIESFSNGKVHKMPAVYPVGPILNEGHDQESNKQQEIMQWLDDQPPSSVVFLCFGSKGGFSDDQVKEIAYAVEHSGHRFLLSLRRPPPGGTSEGSTEYENQEEVLPQGFLNRTAEIGKVIGWAPQAAILAHKAIGGFVSHCGWNSILESIWYGIPIATLPLYAEQQFNAFETVIELGLATEIIMNYHRDSDMIVNRDVIEKGIRSLMEQDREKRKKVKEISAISRLALVEGGSSYVRLGHLIEDVINNNA